MSGSISPGSVSVAPPAFPPLDGFSPETLQAEYPDVAAVTKALQVDADPDQQKRHLAILIAASLIHNATQTLAAVILAAMQNAILYAAQKEAISETLLHILNNKEIEAKTVSELLRKYSQCENHEQLIQLLESALDHYGITVHHVDAICDVIKTHEHAGEILTKLLVKFPDFSEAQISQLLEGHMPETLHKILQGLPAGNVNRDKLINYICAQVLTQDLSTEENIKKALEPYGFERAYLLDTLNAKMREKDTQTRYQFILHVAANQEPYRDKAYRSGLTAGFKFFPEKITPQIIALMNQKDLTWEQMRKLRDLFNTKDPTAKKTPHYLLLEALKQHEGNCHQLSNYIQSLDSTDRVAVSLAVFQQVPNLSTSAAETLLGQLELTQQFALLKAFLDQPEPDDKRIQFLNHYLLRQFMQSEEPSAVAANYIEQITSQAFSNDATADLLVPILQTLQSCLSENPKDLLTLHSLTVLAVNNIRKPFPKKLQQAIDESVIRLLGGIPAELVGGKQKVQGMLKAYQAAFEEKKSLNLISVITSKLGGKFAHAGTLLDYVKEELRPEPQALMGFISQTPNLGDARVMDLLKTIPDDAIVGALRYFFQQPGKENYDAVLLYLSDKLQVSGKRPTHLQQEFPALLEENPHLAIDLLRSPAAFASLAQYNSRVASHASRTKRLAPVLNQAAQYLKQLPTTERPGSERKQEQLRELIFARLFAHFASDPGKIEKIYKSLNDVAGSLSAEGRALKASLEEKYEKHQQENPQYYTIHRVEDFFGEESSVSSPSSPVQAHMRRRTYVQLAHAEYAANSPLRAADNLGKATERSEVRIDPAEWTEDDFNKLKLVRILAYSTTRETEKNWDFLREVLNGWRLDAKTQVVQALIQRILIERVVRSNLADTQSKAVNFITRITDIDEIYSSLTYKELEALLTHLNPDAKPASVLLKRVLSAKTRDSTFNPGIATQLIESYLADFPRDKDTERSVLLEDIYQNVAFFDTADKLAKAFFAALHNRGVYGQAQCQAMLAVLSRKDETFKKAFLKQILSYPSRDLMGFKGLHKLLFDCIAGLKLNAANSEDQEIVQQAYGIVIACVDHARFAELTAGLLRNDSAWTGIILNFENPNTMQYLYGLAYSQETLPIFSNLLLQLPVDFFVLYHEKCQTNSIFAKNLYDAIKSILIQEETAKTLTVKHYQKLFELLPDEDKKQIAGELLKAKPLSPWVKDRVDILAPALTPEQLHKLYTAAGGEDKALFAHRILKRPDSYDHLSEAIIGELLSALTSGAALLPALQALPDTVTSKAVNNLFSVSMGEKTLGKWLSGLNTDLDTQDQIIFYLANYAMDPAHKKAIQEYIADQQYRQPVFHVLRTYDSRMPIQPGSLLYNYLLDFLKQPELYSECSDETLKFLLAQVQPAEIEAVFNANRDYFAKTGRLATILDQAMELAPHYDGTDDTFNHEIYLCVSRWILQMPLLAQGMIESQADVAAMRELLDKSYTEQQAAIRENGQGQAAYAALRANIDAVERDIEAYLDEGGADLEQDRLGGVGRLYHLTDTLKEALENLRKLEQVGEFGHDASIRALKEKLTSQIERIQNVLEEYKGTIARNPCIGNLHYLLKSPALGLASFHERVWRGWQDEGKKVLERHRRAYQLLQQQALLRAQVTPEPVLRELLLWDYDMASEAAKDAAARVPRSLLVENVNSLRAQLIDQERIDRQLNSLVEEVGDEESVAPEHLFQQFESFDKKLLDTLKRHATEANATLLSRLVDVYQRAQAAGLKPGDMLKREKGALIPDSRYSSVGSEVAKEGVKSWLQADLERLRLHGHGLAARQRAYYIEAFRYSPQQPGDKDKTTRDILLDNCYLLEGIDPTAIEIGAIVAVINSYADAPGIADAETTRALIHMLDQLRLQKREPDEIAQLLGYLNEGLFNNIIHYSVAGLTSEDTEHAQRCRRMLDIVTRYAARAQASEHIIAILKEQLDQNSFESFQARFSKLAGDMSRDVRIGVDLASETHNGVWIIRFLLSPQVVAQLQPHESAGLLERFRLISRFLKRNEYQAWESKAREAIPRLKQARAAAEAELGKAKALLKELKQAKETSEDAGATKELVEKRIAELSSEIKSYSQKIEHYEQRKQALLKFKADDSVREMLRQLQGNITSLEQSGSEADQAAARSAREKLSRYLTHELAEQRRDLWYRTLNWLHRELLGSDHGDLENEQKTLLRLVNRYVPHDNFVSRELQGTTQNSLAVGSVVYTHIGAELRLGADFQLEWVNPENGEIKAFTPENFPDSATPGIPLYDSADRASRKVVGVLGETGLLLADNVFMTRTCLNLFLYTPLTELQNLKNGDLLANYILSGSSQLAELYGTLFDPEASPELVAKRDWIKERIQTCLAGQGAGKGNFYQLDDADCRALLEQHSTKELRAIIQHYYKNRSNETAAATAKNLLKHMLLSSEHAESWLGNDKAKNELFAVLKDLALQPDDIQDWLKQPCEHAYAEDCRQILQAYLFTCQAYEESLSGPRLYDEVYGEGPAEVEMVASSESAFQQAVQRLSVRHLPVGILEKLSPRVRCELALTPKQYPGMSSAKLRQLTQGLSADKPEKTLIQYYLTHYTNRLHSEEGFQLFFDAHRQAFWDAAVALPSADKNKLRQQILQNPRIAAMIARDISKYDMWAKLKTDFTRLAQNYLKLAPANDLAKMFDKDSIIQGIKKYINAEHKSSNTALILSTVLFNRMDDIIKELNLDDIAVIMQLAEDPHFKGLHDNYPLFKSLFENLLLKAAQANPPAVNIFYNNAAETPAFNSGRAKYPVSPTLFSRDDIHGTIKAIDLFLRNCPATSRVEDVQPLIADYFASYQRRQDAGKELVSTVKLMNDTARPETVREAIFEALVDPKNVHLCGPRLFKQFRLYTQSHDRELDLGFQAKIKPLIHAYIASHYLQRDGSDTATPRERAEQYLLPAIKLLNAENTNTNVKQVIFAAMLEPGHFDLCGPKIMSELLQYIRQRERKLDDEELRKFRSLIRHYMEYHQYGLPGETDAEHAQRVNRGVLPIIKAMEALNAAKDKPVRDEILRAMFLQKKQPRERRDGQMPAQQYKSQRLWTDDVTRKLFNKNANVESIYKYLGEKGDYATLLAFERRVMKVFQPDYAGPSADMPDDPWAWTDEVIRTARNGYARLRGMDADSSEREKFRAACKDAEFEQRIQKNNLISRRYERFKHYNNHGGFFAAVRAIVPIGKPKSSAYVKACDAEQSAESKKRDSGVVPADQLSQVSPDVTSPGTESTHERVAGRLSAAQATASRKEREAVDLLKQAEQSLLKFLGTSAAELNTDSISNVTRDIDAFKFEDALPSEEEISLREQFDGLFRKFRYLVGGSQVDVNGESVVAEAGHRKALRNLMSQYKGMAVNNRAKLETFYLDQLTTDPHNFIARRKLIQLYVRRMEVDPADAEAMEKLNQQIEFLKTTTSAAQEQCGKLLADIKVLRSIYQAQGLKNQFDKCMEALKDSPLVKQDISEETAEVKLVAGERGAATIYIAPILKEKEKQIFQELVTLKRKIETLAASETLASEPPQVRQIYAAIAARLAVKVEGADQTLGELINANMERLRSREDTSDSAPQVPAQRTY